MAATTTLLGLVTPTQGSLPGVWGDTVNYGISDYLDIAIAGTLSFAGDGAITLANTTGSSSGNSIGATTAQYAIIRVTGTLTTAKIITGPSYSKTYLVVNAATGSTVTFKASGQTGVSIAVGETALVYYNGTDYVKVVGTATAGAAGGSTTQVQYNNSGVLAGITGATTNGTVLTLVTPVLGVATATSLQGIIGNVTPAAGAFTTLSATGTLSGGTSGTAYSFSGSAPATSLTLDSSGNLGIGTSSPTKKLSITGTGNNETSGSIQTTNSNAGTGTQVGFWASNGTQSAQFSLAGTGYTAYGAYAAGNIAIYNDQAITLMADNASTGIIKFATGGSTERARIDSSGNLGIGTSSPAQTLHVKTSTSATPITLGVLSNATALPALSFNGAYASTTMAGIYSNGGTATSLYYEVPSGQNHFFGIADSTKMTLDASGNLGIGTTTPQNKLQVQTTTRPQFSVSYNGTTGLYLEDGTNSSWKSWKLSTSFGSGSDLSFVQSTNTSGTPTWAASAAMTLDANGNLLVGTTSGSYNKIVKSNNADYVLRVENSLATAPYVLELMVPTASANDTSYVYWIARNADNTNRAYIYGNGGLANYSANNVNLSDRREKTNFAPATSYLDKICAIPVQTFNYIDQNLETDGGLTLGVIAQDVQAVAPELVTESNWGSQDDPKMRLSVYQTDLQYALMKCIQEQQALITQLTARITALETA